MTEPKIPMKSPCVLDEQPGVRFWCACGGSASQPFCDGSHKGTGFSPLKIELTETKKIAWCGCKHSSTPPYCDGSHKRL